MLGLFILICCLFFVFILPTIGANYSMTGCFTKRGMHKKTLSLIGKIFVQSNESKFDHQTGKYTTGNESGLEIISYKAKHNKFIVRDTKSQYSPYYPYDAFDLLCKIKKDNYIELYKKEG